jgi:alpha-1,2-mannosyltransferase
MHALVWGMALTLTIPLASRLSQVFIPNDLDVYTNASRAIIAGQSPYSVSTSLGVAKDSSQEFFYLYSPLLAVLLIPLTFLSDESARVVWSSITVGSFAVTAYLGSRIQLWKPILSPIVLILLTLLPFSIDTFTTGQIDGIILMLFMVATVAAVKPNNLLLGSSVGVAALLKTSPALLLIPLIFSPSTRRASGVAFITVCCTVVVTSLVWGTEMWFRYAETLSTVSNGGMSWDNPANRAPAKLLRAISPLPLSPAASTSIITLVLVCPILLVMLLRKTIRREEIVALTIGTIVLSSPIVWYHHLLWLIIPIAIGWRNSTTVTSRFTVAVCALTLVASLVLDLTFAAVKSDSSHLAEQWGGIVMATYAVIFTIIAFPSNRNRPVRAGAVSL